MFVKRNIFSILENDISRKEVSILLGPRQVGKTSLLRILERECKKRGLRSRFLDLEQPEDLRLLNAPRGELIHLLTDDTDVIFLDEFHYLKNATQIFKAIYDGPYQTKIFASGSSSLEIHKHLKESLAGRKRSYAIFPLSFEEWQGGGGKSLDEYCTYGGMPGLLKEATTDSKMNLLQEILQTYLLKDIKALILEENLRAFNHLLYLLAQSQGSLISGVSLGNEIRMSLTGVEHYLEILSQTYVLHPLLSYSTNLGNELKKSRKFFFYDLGIRNVLLKDFRPPIERPDQGVIFETFSYLALKPLLLPNMELRFWRTRSGDEVDFILVKDRQPYPIEVKSDLDSPQIPKGLTLFLKRYPKTRRAFVVNLRQTKTINYHSTPVEFLLPEQVSLIPEKI